MDDTPNTTPFNIPHALPNAIRACHPNRIELPLSVRSTVAALFNSDAEVDLCNFTREVLVETPSVSIEGDCIVWPTDSSSEELCVPVSVQDQPGDVNAQSVYAPE